MTPLGRRPGLNAALAAYRALRGLSPEDMARAARLERYKLLAYEQGRTAPQPATLQRIAEALDVTIPDLEALADLLAPFGDLSARRGTTTQAIQSGVRLVLAMEAALEEQLEALSAAMPRPRT